LCIKLVIETSLKSMADCVVGGSGNREKLLLGLSYPSVCMYMHRRNWTDLISRTFTKICRGTPNFINVGQQRGALCMKT
jgi:hypothetical protein